MSELDLPPVRGQLLRNESLAPFTWFRVGGPADAVFLPADADDLAQFLAALPANVPVLPIGVGSNLIVRDAGIPGVVVRLAGRAWAQVEALDGARVRAGAGALDSMVAKGAAKAGIAGLEFYVGVPGTIGGALTMNAGCYGRETKDILVSARGYSRRGEGRLYGLADFGFAYRRSQVEGVIWVEATFEGGLLEYWDAVSVHPYRQKPAATVTNDYAKLRELIGRFSKGEVPVPGPQNGRYAAEPIGGLTSLKEFESGRKQYNASAQLAVDIKDTVKRIDGTEVPLTTPWLGKSAGAAKE